MNNMLKSLLVTALAISASHVSAATNKNFLSVTRPQEVGLVLNSALKHDLVHTNPHDRFGGNFLVRGYYSESTNDKALGKYFGVKNKNSFNATAVGNAATSTVDVNAAYLIHDINAGAEALIIGTATDGATVNLSPKTSSLGLEFAYKQCLSKILDGLYLAISLPVEQVQNNLNFSLTSPVNARDTKALTDFFAGNLSTAVNTPTPFTPAGNASGPGQAALTKALIKNGKQTATGIADINVILGYDFLREENWGAGLNIGFVIPTGNTATGKNVFEPIYGNGGHWELGFGGHLDGKLWQEEEHQIGMNVSFDYRYGFQSNETRTLSTANSFSQYYLLSKAAVHFDAQVLTPAANITTVPLSITPNSAVRGNVGFTYNFGGLVAGLSYAPAWKEKESVTYKGSYTDGSYGLAASQQTHSGNNPNYDGAFGAALLDDHGVALNKADLLTDSAARDSQVSHRLGADLGYTFKEWEFPVTLGVGGHYEFAGSNVSAENWAVSLTTGIGF